MANGNGVRTEYYTFGSPSTLRHVGDANGSAGGCGTELSEDGWEIQRFRVCEANVGCSAWNWTD